MCIRPHPFFEDSFHDLKAEGEKKPLNLKIWFNYSSLSIFTEAWCVVQVPPCSVGSSYWHASPTFRNPMLRSEHSATGAGYEVLMQDNSTFHSVHSFTARSEDFHRSDTRALPGTTVCEGKNFKNLTFRTVKQALLFCSKAMSRRLFYSGFKKSFKKWARFRAGHYPFTTRSGEECLRNKQKYARNYRHFTTWNHEANEPLFWCEPVYIKA